MIRVQVRPNETLEAALRRFKRQCNYAGIFRLAKKHSFHEKRSDKRRREERERIRNIQRAMRKAGMKGKPRSMKRGRGKGRSGGGGGDSSNNPAEETKKDDTATAATTTTTVEPTAKPSAETQAVTPPPVAAPEPAVAKVEGSNAPGEA